MKAFLQYLLVSLLILTGLCFVCQYVYDGDNFYHLGHASVYWEKGPFFRPFPWVTYSVISQHNSDLWWGFHVLLAPLSVLRDKVLILAVGPGFLMLLHLLISRAAVIRLGMNQWYGLALLPASLGYLTRMDTVRPQILSSALLLLIFAALVTEVPWLALTASLFLGLFHPTLSYMILLVGLFTFMQRGLYKKNWAPWLELSCLTVALAVACIRPGIIDGLELMKIQLLDLMQVRKAGEVKNFGVELEKINLAYFYRAFMSPVIVLAIGVVCFLRFRDKEKSTAALWACFGVVVASFLLSLLITRRGVDQFAPFTVLAALLFFHLSKDLKKFTAVVFGLHIAYVLGAMGLQAIQRTHPRNATDYRGATEWLAANTQPGEIVGQSVWSDFGPLFYWNKHNRYFGGMDPIFQYRYNPSTYWIMTLTAAGRDPGKTAPYNPLKVSDKEEPISTVFPRDMKTRWLLCSKTWSEVTQEELKKDPHVKIRYEDQEARVYEFIP